MGETQLVDAFVEKVNASPRERELLEHVPDALREEPSDEHWTAWRIKPSNNVARISALQKRVGIPFPPSFRDLLFRYSFPAFEFGPMVYFANTGEDLFWELTDRLFLDPNMSPVLLEAGYVQIGNPYFYNYDPVCFAPGKNNREKRIVQLDHEAILQFRKLQIVCEIAPSFLELMRVSIKRGDA